MNAEIKWNKQAVKQLQSAIKYINQDSPANADKVKKDILDKIESLKKYPEKFSPDKYKLQNQDFSFRAFEIHHYRISYRFVNNEIRILRIRHTKMNPKYY